ncbi:plastocyanin/azurin family copper-binding protein [Nostoc sp.]|uniref:plastocyanin/azurin family copper-binding protein n=1 Tax=Nostoc sp. TaxID=1180 RepID=UPI002FF597AF
MTSKMNHFKDRTLPHLPAWISTTLIRPMRKVKALSLIVALILSVLSLLPGTAQAATTEVQIGSARGKLVFEPSTVTIKAGDTIKWVNNLSADSACNVVFDKVAFDTYNDTEEDPKAIDPELFSYLSHKNVIKEPTGTFTKIFNVPEGKYTYACTPHQSEGMIGQVIVER